MNVLKINSLSFLDRVRINEGTDKLIGLYDNLVRHKTIDAIILINDFKLHFCSLFVLQPTIESYNLFDLLNYRNQNALSIINKILEKNTLDKEYQFDDNKQMKYSTLKWILETGYFDDGLNNHYDEVLDKTSILLIKLFNDKSILNIITHMIFNRNRKGLYIYDLVWALFDSRDPYVLINIAYRLLSAHSKDIQLAEKLLSFIPDMHIGNKQDNLKQCANVLNWINENIPFLSYLGQSFNQTPTPKPYIVSLESKYLCGFVSLGHDDTLRLDEDQIKILKNFRLQENKIQVLLSKYSFLIYQQDPDLWNEWYRYPIKEQIIFARKMFGGQR